jgi:nucleotide-binding universal stress UspA family protein
MKRILVGIDGSDESKAAAEHAARLAQATHSALELAYVLPVIVEPSFGGATTASVWRTEQTLHARVMLNEMSQSVPRPNTPVDTSLLEGSAADRLAEEAQRPDVWLVVVGHRGRGAIGRMLLGSVADRLAQISPKPVLIVR